MFNPDPKMVSSTLCPAAHILGSQNVYGRAEGIADHYWPCFSFSLSLFLSLLTGGIVVVVVVVPSIVVVAVVSFNHQTGNGPLQPL